MQSQRYVKLTHFEYVTPPEIEAVPEALALYDETMQRCVEAYRALTEILEARHLEAFLADGVPEKERFVLPNASETKMVVTMNARELLHFFRLRCCRRAQWEIRALAKAMVAEVYAVSPGLFAKAGPSCVGGACPEGKMSCGCAAEVRAEYEALKAQAAARGSDDV